MGRFRRALAFRFGRVRDSLDRLRARVRPARLGLIRKPASVLSHGRRSGAFNHTKVERRFQHSVEIEGRLYNYVHYPGDRDVLCVHFSAFFGEWGDARPYRKQFAGYFHRLRMFWPLRQYHFLFLCDTFGAEQNGSYYKGEAGDFFVERAMDEMIGRVRRELGFRADQVVTLGSSMGATGALRVALRQHFAGIVAVSPHIDLDLSAIHQGRRQHVAAIVGRDDVEDEALYAVTREIRGLVEDVRPLPRLVIQSMLDDHGVHAEQVVPLVETWRAGGGDVLTDYRETGGHTSDHAPAGFFADSVEWILAGNAPERG